MKALVSYLVCLISVSLVVFGIYVAVAVFSSRLLLYSYLDGSKLSVVLLLAVLLCSASLGH